MSPPSFQRYLLKTWCSGGVYHEMVINKELLLARKKISDKRPKFVRQESWRYDRLAENWRKPKGKDNKMRLQVSGVPRRVKIGYRGPRSARGLHPSGFTDNLVHNVAELERLDPNTDAARIAHTVGKRKRVKMVSKATELKIKVLNAGVEDKEKRVTKESGQSKRDRESKPIADKTEE